jgi:hypothetical protein
LSDKITFAGRDPTFRKAKSCEPCDPYKLGRQRLKRLRCKPEPLRVTVLYPHRQHLPRRLQAFIEWAATLLTVEMRLTSPTA